MKRLLAVLVIGIVPLMAKAADLALPRLFGDSAPALTTAAPAAVPVNSTNKRPERAACKCGECKCVDCQCGECKCGECKCDDCQCGECKCGTCASAAATELRQASATNKRPSRPGCQCGAGCQCPGCGGRCGC